MDWSAAEPSIPYEPNEVVQEKCGEQMQDSGTEQWTVLDVCPYIHYGSIGAYAQFRSFWAPDVHFVWPDHWSTVLQQYSPATFVCRVISAQGTWTSLDASGHFDPGPTNGPFYVERTSLKPISFGHLYRACAGLSDIHTFYVCGPYIAP